MAVLLLAGCSPPEGQAPNAKSGEAPDPDYVQLAQLAGPWGAVAPGDGYLAAASHNDGELLVWRVAPDRSVKLVGRSDKVGFHPDRVRAGAPWPQEGGNLLYVAAEGSGQVQIWSVSEQGIDLLHSTRSGASPQDLLPRDLDQDGLVDFAVGPYGGDKLYLMWNQGDGQYQVEVVQAGRAPSYVREIDWNQDGLPDLVWTEWSTGAVKVALNQGARRFNIVTIEPPGFGSPRVHGVGDVDGDGLEDIVVPLETGGGARVYFADGKGGTREVAFLPTDQSGGYTSAAVGRDEEGPLVAASYTDRIELARWRDGKWERRWTPAGKFVLDIAFSDLDQDGQVDLVFANSSSNDIGALFGPIWKNALPDPGEKKGGKE